MAVSCGERVLSIVIKLFSCRMIEMEVLRCVNAVLLLALDLVDVLRLSLQGCSEEVAINNKNSQCAE